MAENRKTLNFAANMAKLREQNKAVEESKETESAKVEPSKEERVDVSSSIVEPKKKGRPKKASVLELNIGINVFLDKPLHKKLQYTKAETDIGIKDLIYMATDYVMNELFEDGTPNKEGERVIREFKEKMFGAE